MADLDWGGAPATPEDYLSLRAACGMSERSAEGAKIAISNTLFAVWLRDNGQLVGMGRIIGDGGTFVQLNDVAVLPAYRGQGLGTAIVRRLLDWCGTNLPPLCMINLIANEKAVPIYEREGFFHCPGMARYSS